MTLLGRAEHPPRRPLSEVKLPRQSAPHEAVSDTSVCISNPLCLVFRRGDDAKASGLKAADNTCSCPRGTRSSLPFPACQIGAVLSREAVTMREPPPKYALEVISSSCPFSLGIILLSHGRSQFICQMVALRAAVAVTICVPSGLKAATAPR